MKFNIRRTTRFKKDAGRLVAERKNMEKLLSVISELAEGRKLPLKHKDHPLRGEYKGKRDCHIEPDRILICAIEDGEARSVSHRNAPSFSVDPCVILRQKSLR